MYLGTHQGLMIFLISHFLDISRDFSHKFLTLFISDDAFVHRGLLNFDQLIYVLTTVFDALPGDSC